MAIWDAYLSERDRRIFGGAGYGQRAGFGRRPAILVIDVNYNFVGDRPEPIEDSIKRWRNSCGAEGWTGVRHIATLLDAARERGLPVIYSTGNPPRSDGFDSGRWADKNSRRREDLTASSGADRALGNTIAAPIAPHPEDIVIEKNKPDRSRRRAPPTATKGK